MFRPKPTQRCEVEAKQESISKLTVVANCEICGCNPSAIGTKSPKENRPMDKNGIGLESATEAASTNAAGIDLGP
jgi:hypothetical protein